MAIQAAVANKKQTNSSGMTPRMHYVGMECGQPLYTKPPQNISLIHTTCSQVFFTFENLDVSNMFHQILKLILCKGRTITSYILPRFWALPWCATKILSNRDSRKMESAKWLGDEPESLGGNYRFPR